MLKNMETRLNAMNVSNSIVHETRTYDMSPPNRIQSLAIVRNKALAPMFNVSKPFDKIIFINDSTCL
jgi:Cryptococcal mannosyltransferase 1